MSKLINKSIIKAMTIGISAVMTFSSVNLGVFAGEDVPGGDADNTNGNVDPITDGSEAQTKSGIMQALDKAGEVKDLVSNDSKETPGVVQLVDEVVAAAEKEEIKEETKELVNDIKEVVDTDKNESEDIVEDVDKFDDIVDENGDVVEEGSIAAMDDELSKEELGELAEDVAEAVNDMNDPSLEGVIAATEKVLDEKIGTTENEDGTVNEEKSELKETVASADEAAQQINSLVEAADFDALAEQVKGIIAAANQKIANATTVEEAEAAAKEARDAVDGFTSQLEEFTSEDGDYAALAKQYGDAVEKSNHLNNLYNDLSAQLAAAVERFNALQATASGDAETAKQEIVDLENAVNALKEKADAAKNASVSEAQMTVGELEKYINEAGSKRSWTAKDGKGLRDLCMLIVDNYIIPEVLNGEKVSSEEYHSHKNQGTYEGDNQFNGSSKSDVLDNYEVTYALKDENGNVMTDDEGNLVTRTIRIGYKSSNGNNITSNNYGGIVIFEKTEHTVVNGTDLTEDELTTLDTENGYVEKTINDVDYIITKNADGVIESYKVSDFQTTVNQVVDSDNRVDGIGTKVEVDENSATTSYDYNEEGQLVKTVTADVTTTTYTGTTLTSGVDENVENKALSSETAAKESYVSALNNIIDTLGDNSITIKVAKEVVNENGEKETQLVPVTIDSKTEITVDNCADFGFSVTSKDYTANNQSILTEYIPTADDEELSDSIADAKALFVARLNAFIETNLKTEENLKTGDKKYAITVKTATGTETKYITKDTVITNDNAEEYGFVYTDTESKLDLANQTITALKATKDSTNETAVKQAYIDAIDAIRNAESFGDDQFIEIVTGMDETTGKDITVKIFKDTEITVDNVTQYGYKAANDNTNKDITGYTITGTFRKTFTETVNADDGYNLLSKEWAKDNGYYKAIGEVKDELDDKDGTYAIVENPSKDNVDADGYFELFGRKGYYSRGTVAVKYAEVTSELKHERVSFWAIPNDVWGSVKDLITGEDHRIMAENKIREELAKRGQVFVSLDGYTGLDGIGNAVVYYVDMADLNQTEDVTVTSIGENETDAQAFERGLNNTDANATINVISTEKTTNYTEPWTSYGYEKVSYAIRSKLFGYNTVSGDLVTTKYGYEGVDGIKADPNTVENSVILEEKNSANGVAATTEYRNENWYTGNVLLAEYDNGSYTTDKYSGETDRQGKAIAKTVTLTEEDKKTTAKFRAWADAAIKVLEYGELAEKAGVALDKIGSAKTEIGNLQEQIDGLKKSLKQYKLAVISGDITKAEEALEAAQGYDFTNLLDSINDALKEKTADLTKVVEDDTNTEDQNTQTEEGEATRTSDNQQGTDDGTAIDDNTATDNTATNDGVADDNAADYENADDGNADGGNADGGAANDDAAGNDGAVAGGNDGAAGGNAGGGEAGGNDGAAVDDNNGAADGNGDNVTIENENAALAEGIGDADGNANEGGAGKDSVTIGNEDSALAEGIDTVQTHRKWNWWWLLIVAALTGGTTYGIIKGNRRKKEKANGDSDKKEI